MVRRIGRALVEHHRDVGVEDALDAHRLLGREKQGIPVYRGLEPDALLADPPERPETEYLEAAGIREYRAVPAHEAVQSAVRGDHFESRPQPQVEGVAENDLRAQRLQLL